MGNPIQYTSRDFTSITNDINADTTLTDKPIWFKRLIAGVGDIFSMWLNAAVNDLYLRTAFTRQSVSDLCALISYVLLPQTTSTGTLLFYVDTSIGSAIFPFTVSYLNLRSKSQGSLTLSSQTFQAIVNQTFSLVQAVFTTNFAVNSKLTVATDFQFTGHKVRVSTTVTLPAPLLANTDYYIVYTSATTIALATSLANAYAGNIITLTSDGAGVQTLTLYSAAVTAYQQDFLTTAISIGQSDGVTAWQEFVLPDEFILPNTLSIAINSVIWTQVTDFASSGASSTVYKVIQLSDNQDSIRFGNGTYGLIPPSNFSILANYAVGGGANSNLAVTNGINTYAGNDTHILGVSNPVTFTGGADQQNINDAKNLGPLSIKTRDRFITVQDGITLALNFGGLSLVTIIRNAYGPLSCQVVGIANGGGNPSGALEANLQTYLINLTVLQSITVQVTNATITAENITAQMHILPTYVWANLLPYFRLAVKLQLTEAGAQILSTYKASGIVSAVTLINTIFGETFGQADYTQITSFLNNFVPRNFGDTIQLTTIIAFIQSFLVGCDYVTISVPSAAITTVLTEITTIGVLTLTQILP